MGTVEERFTQLTSAILRETSAFLALSEQEQHIVNMFDVRSFNFQDPESLYVNNITKNSCYSPATLTRVVSYSLENLVVKYVWG